MMFYYYAPKGGRDTGLSGIQPQKLSYSQPNENHSNIISLYEREKTTHLTENFSSEEKVTEGEIRGDEG